MAGFAQRAAPRDFLYDFRAGFATEVVEALGLNDVALNAALIDAFAVVPREQFVEPALGRRAYENIALPIGYGQTISKPSTIARMLAALKLKPGEKVLEIGAGSGYVAALLSALGATVFAVEKVALLAQAARTRLDRLGLQKIILRSADGARGWPEMAPFDAILVSAAFADIPVSLLDQLSDNGRLIAPITERQPHRVSAESGQNSEDPAQQLQAWYSVRLAAGCERCFVSKSLGACHFVTAS